MPPKRKSDNANLDPGRTKFQKRGDLDIYHHATQSDCALHIGDGRILVHKAILISRSRYFKILLPTGRQGPVDDRGRAKLTIDSHDLRSVRLVVEFIYGTGSVEMMEYPSKEQPIIQDCILLHGLGHDFGVPDMSAYATRHLGMYLSKKLRDICLYPVVPKAMDAVAPRGFMDDLEAGVNAVYKANANPGGAAGGGGKDKDKDKDDDPNHPRRMLVDFVVAGRDVLLRDAGLRFSIDQDSFPPSFIKDVLLAQFGRAYKSAWMRGLVVRPLEKPQKLKRRCAGCGEGIAKDETAVFNPWSAPSLAQRYAQVCCEECALGMEEKGAGVSWGVFGGIKE